MNVELLVIPNDKDEWRAGMVVATAPNGFYLEPARYERWVTGKERPPELDTLKPARRAVHEYFAARMERVLKGLTVEEVAVTRGMQIKDAQKWLDGKLRQHANLMQYGYDCNWGIKELPAYSVIFADMTAEDVYEATTEPTDLTRDPLARRETVGRRGLTLPLAKILDAEDLARAKDPTVRVIPPRGGPGLIPVTLAHFEAVK